MGRLSGITYRMLAKKLRVFGFVFWREAKGSHEIWHSREAERYTTIPRHAGDMAEGTVRAILKQADVDVDEFLDA